MSEPFDPYRKWLGIPPKDQPPNHYRLLAVELFEDDLDIISNAADRLMAHVRTFQSGPHAAASQKLLNELAAARHCLLDAAKKSEYDQALRNRLLATQAPAPAMATPQPIAPQPIAPVPVAPVPVAPIMAPVPVAAPQPYPQPVQAFAAPQQPATPYVSTTSRMRRKSAWPALVVATITAAMLLVAGFYLVQLNKRPSPVPAKPLAANANASSVEPVNNVESPADESLAERASKRQREAAAGRMPARQPQGQPNNAAPVPPRRVVVTEQPLDLGAMVGKMAVGSVDLLKLINVDRDAVKGEWLLENGRLISPQVVVPRLAIPYRLPPEYLLTVVVERLEGDDSFSVGLIAGDFKAAATLDGWRRTASGLHLLDGRSAEDNASTHPGRVLRDGVPNTLVFTVAKHGIRVTANGESIVDFSGDFRRLSWPDNWEPPVSDRLELMGSSNSRFAISKLELTTISDPANVAGPLGGSPSMSADGEEPAKARGKPNERRTLGALINGPEVKAPVPEKQELAKAERQVRELFDVALANASDPGQKLLLADKLMDKADESGDATAGRYVLLKMARDLAAESGGAKVAARAANEMANWFQVDSRELKLEAFAKAGKTASTAQQKQELFDAALSLVDDFIAANEFDKASKAASIAQAAARSLKNPQLAKDVTEKKREAERIAKDFLKIRDDLARLDADENDPAANSAVGKFYCLTKSDWQRGLELLARGDDPAYKSLAERDLAEPEATEDQKALADEWWELGQRDKGPARKALLQRASYWYRQAERFLTGLDKETAQKRMAELASDAPTGASMKYLIDIPEAGFSVDKNWLGKGKDGDGRELKVNGQLTPKGLFMPPPDKGAASVTYRLNKKALLFTADVGLNSPYRSSSNPLIFEVWGDGGLLWRSKPIKLAEDVDHCEAPLGKIQVLELRVLCPGDNFGAKAVWVEPRLTLK